jgi:pimeloyl-ACP methyl ester carboxylesterase
MQKNWVETSWGRVGYMRSGGRGPVVVLLHSNSTSGEIFSRQFAGLGKRFSLVAVDLPGHGRSADLQEPFSYGLVSMAAVVGVALDRLGINDPLMVGTSLGGHVVLEMMRHRHMAGAMLVGTPPYARDPAGIGEAYRPDPVAALSFVGELSPQQVADFADALNDGHPDTTPWRRAIMRTDPNMRLHLAAGLFDPEAGDQRQLAENSAVPLAIVNGAEDRFVDLDYVDSLAYANLWSGRTYRIAGAGHAPFVSQPEAFNTILNRMVEDVFGA